MLAGLVVSNWMCGSKPSACAAAVRMAWSPLPAGRQTNGSSRRSDNVRRRVVAESVAGRRRGDNDQLFLDQLLSDVLCRKVGVDRAEDEVDLIGVERDEQRRDQPGAQREGYTGVTSVEDGQRGGQVDSTEDLSRAEHDAAT